MKFISSFSMIKVEAIKMKKQRYYLSLNSEETRLVLRSLIRMKGISVNNILTPLERRFLAQRKRRYFFSF